MESAAAFKAASPLFGNPPNCFEQHPAIDFELMSCDLSPSPENRLIAFTKSAPDKAGVGSNLLGELIGFNVNFKIASNLGLD